MRRRFACQRIFGNGEVLQLITTSGFEFECIDSHCWPEELGIPIEWIDPETPQI